MEQNLIVVSNYSFYSLFLLKLPLLVVHSLETRTCYIMFTVICCISTFQPDFSKRVLPCTIVSRMNNVLQITSNLPAL